MNKREIILSTIIFIILIIVSIISYIFFDKVIAENIGKIKVSFLIPIMYFFSNIFVLTVIFLLFIYILIKKKRDYLLSLFYTLITFILVYILKFIFSRPRPLYGIYSFPSAHAAFTFSLASILNFRIKEQKIYFITFLIYAIITSFSRIYLNMHYLSDVFAGALIGYFTPLILKHFIEKNEKET